MASSIDGISSLSLTPSNILVQLAGINAATSLQNTTPNAVSNELLTFLEQQSTSYTVEISQFGSLLNDFSSLQNAVSALRAPSAFSPAANSSNSAVASATADSSAAPGFYVVQVNQVAEPQVLLSSAQASPTQAIGTGAPTTLTFNFGSLSGGVFTPSTLSQAVQVNTNTLQGIADSINNANIGVEAFVVRDGAGYHLEIASNTTGAKSAFSVSVTGDAALSSMLSYDPAGTQNMSQLMAAQDAQFSIDGLAATSPSNTVSGIVPGLTLNIAGVGSASISLQSSVDGALTNVQNFVSAFDALQSDLGALSGNPLAQQLGSDIGNIFAGALGFNNIGLFGQAGGMLSLDSGLLQQAFSSNPTKVASLFSNTGGTGLADQFQALINAYAAQNTGSIPAEISTLFTRMQQFQTAAQLTQNELAPLQSQLLDLSSLLSSLQSTNQTLLGL